MSTTFASLRPEKGQERSTRANPLKVKSQIEQAKNFPLFFALGVGAYLILVFCGFLGLRQLLPDRIAFNILGHSVVRDGLHSHLYFKFLVLSLIVPGMLLIELGIVGWANSSLRRLVVGRTRSGTTDLTYFIIDQTPLMSGLTFVASLGAVLVSASVLHGLIRRLTGLDLSLAWAPAVGQLPVYFLAYSFFDYWSHRLDHSRWFWPLHRFHHAMDDFCIISSVRVHPAAFTRIVQQAAPAALVGASPEIVVELSFILIIFRYMLHSRIDSNFGWIGRYLVQSPTHHRLHHSLEAGPSAGHFSLLPVWDHLFGTWRGEATQSLPIGVDTPYRHGAWLVPDLWRDYREFWAGLVPTRRKQSASS